MAATSSPALSQALLSRPSLPSTGAPNNQSSLSLPSFSRIKLSPLSAAHRRRRLPSSASRSAIRASSAAVET
ncbi:hypothetical protein CRG98_009188, partial [Punica granatum]